MILKPKHAIGTLLRDKAFPQDNKTLFYVKGYKKATNEQIMYEIRYFADEYDSHYDYCLESFVDKHYAVYINPNRLWAELNGE